ncbi:hypothetical protein ACQPZ2_34610 [Nocardia pseudovaccinii]|uniref:hypothetical protein n=1 Tax=Nocardia pseudovaccinii TaxID=189540 RepID=UPI003D91B0CD
MTSSSPSPWPVRLSIEAALDSIELAAGRPHIVKPKVQPQPTTFEDELTEDELIELNERRNQSWFR